jgi:hypothetical protein
MNNIAFLLAAVYTLLVMEIGDREYDEFCFHCSCSRRQLINGVRLLLRFTDSTFNAPVDASMDCLAGIDRHTTYTHIALPIRTYVYASRLSLIRVQTLSLSSRAA